MDVPCMRFVEKFVNNYEKCDVPFYITTLKNAIQQAFFADSFSWKRVLLLYFHNDSDEFSKQFCSYLKHKDVADFINDYFYVLAWDITVEIEHDMLKAELKSQFDIDAMANMITKKKSAVYLIMTVSDIPTVFSFMHTSITKENLMEALKQVQKAMDEENIAEKQLQGNKDGSENEIDSIKFHEMMYNGLGDRDYDCLEHNQHKYIKEKIGFALYGPPTEETGYDKKQHTQINHIYEQIRQINNEHTKWHDRIIISFIYNCTEPLLKEKLARQKKYSDYNPKTDINPVPIFVLRKCKGSENPCRVFIDHQGRMYTSWKAYLENNKLPKCKMILPKDGRYQGEDKILLEEHLSPACDVSKAVLRGADIASTAAGVTSGFVFIAAMVPAITVAPIALTAAAVTGVTVGIYSIVRSSLTLSDRRTHRETLSFANSEARGAYLNIVAGSLGFVGAGATAAVSQLSARGVNIGVGARIALNTLNGANIAAGGIGVANSTYDIIYQLVIDGEKPSALQLLQLSSSILFFGNAVYNFRTAGTIIEESQGRALSEINDSLRSNRHRKTFNKLLKETIRQSGDSKGKAEVIATLKNINQRDEVLAVLTRSNKNFNKAGIKFSTEGGQILLNGQSVDILSYGNMPQTSQTQFHLDLPPVPESFSTADSNKIISKVSETFNVGSLDQLIMYGTKLIQLDYISGITELLSHFTEPIQAGIIKITKLLLEKVMPEKNYFFGNNFLLEAIKIVMRFLRQKVDEMEEDYQEELSLAKNKKDFNEKEFHATYKINPTTAKRSLYFFEKCICNFFINVELGLRELMFEFNEWLAGKIYNFGVNILTKEEREKHQKYKPIKTNCDVCGGYFYKQGVEPYTPHEETRTDVQVVNFQN